MLYGSFFLLLYSLFYYLQLNVGGRTLKQSQLILQCGILLIGLCSIGCYLTFNKYLICVLAILIGILHSFYENRFQQQESKNNPVFEVCLQFIDRMQKIFILCPMPFITMIILKKDDVEWCFMWICMIGLSGILYGYLSTYISDKYLNKAKRMKKIE